MKPFKDFLHEQMEDPEFKKAYEKESLEIRLALELSKLRKESGLTQEELAKRMNTKQIAISRIENAEIKTFESLMNYLDALGAKIDFQITKQ